MKLTTIRKSAVPDEKNPKDADKEAGTTGMAGRSLLLADRVVFHDISYTSDGVGSLPAPGPLVVYPDWAGRNNSWYPARLAVVSLAK